MKIRLAAYLQSDSIVDGEGIRTVIWTQGCPHHCLGCQNFETQDFKGTGLYHEKEKHISHHYHTSFNIIPYFPFNRLRKNTFL